ncbi:MAG TPA: RusA family crossover junction endodeoxyribonuclease [Tepidisphaeraceae bacterium]|jgi:Holliday junction resolvase RusA-like endonuclease|nr:RusA family crossover junction endodeoxyribonuclease [Tepidisphaeraceae bacterium]
MGLNPRMLSKEVLASAGIHKLASGRVRRKLKPALDGYVMFHLVGEPPTATHHDKTIAFRAGRQCLVDSPKLQLARRWYLDRIPERSELVPLNPRFGIVARFEFRWSLPLDTNKWPALATYGGYRHEKPDLDNLKKVVLDVLGERGWVVDDSHVTKDGGSEKRWCHPHEKPGVKIYLRSLARHDDSGATILPAPGEPAGTLHPAPWVIAADVAACHKSQNNPLHCFNGAPEAVLTGRGGALRVELKHTGNGHASGPGLASTGRSTARAAKGRGK